MPMLITINDERLINLHKHFLHKYIYKVGDIRGHDNKNNKTFTMWLKQQQFCFLR